MPKIPKIAFWFPYAGGFSLKVSQRAIVKIITLMKCRGKVISSSTFANSTGIFSPEVDGPSRNMAWS